MRIRGLKWKSYDKFYPDTHGVRSRFCCANLPPLEKFMFTEPRELRVGIREPSTEIATIKEFNFNELMPR